MEKQVSDVATETKASAPAAKQASKRTGWKKYLDHTSIYGFELLMATFGLTVAAVVIDYGLFAFFNYLKGMESESYNTAVVGEFSLWIVAAMLVWLPLAIVFYLRTRGQLATDTGRRQSSLHKVIVSIFQFINIIIAAGALFVFLYALIRLAVSADSAEAVGDVLVRVALPAVLMVVVHGWLLFAYSRSARVTRKLFSLVFGIAGVVVMIGLLVTSVGTIRGQAFDERKEQDLRVISSALSSHYRTKMALPRSLDDLDLDKDDLKLPLDEYTYDRKDATRYELCARFATKKGDKTQWNTVLDDSDDGYSGYSTYGYFEAHDKGYDCFKLRVSSYSSLNSLR